MRGSGAAGHNGRPGKHKKPMTISIEIQTDNSAFSDSNGDENEQAKLAEVARILRIVTSQIESGDDHGTCRDYNGNKVGNWAI